jgi:hypothetical protein
MRIVAMWIGLVLMMVLAGCEASPPGDAATAQTDNADAPPPPPPAGPSDNVAGSPAEGDPAAAPDSATPPADESQPSGQEAAAADGSTVEKAGVGSGAKGRDYGGPGFVTTPIETLFRADDLIVFEAHIPKNLSLYKAEHNNKGPKSHEEFMQVIIKDGGVRLPELPTGEEYWYDAKAEQLNVRHPKPAQP